MLSASVLRHAIPLFQSAPIDYIRKPLSIIDVQVAEYGKTRNVVDAARQVGARVLGIRVKSQQEYEAVATWLKEDTTRRAVLFHTAGYRPGYELFAEFPAQTTFGDGDWAIVSVR
jgi:hypothetical protein